MIENCPLDRYEFPTTDHSEVTWVIPDVIDNVDALVVPEEVNNRRPPLVLADGQHRFEYNARDEALNQALPCVFTIYVQSKDQVIANGLVNI